MFLKLAVKSCFLILLLSAVVVARGLEHEPRQWVRVAQILVNGPTVGTFTLENTNPQVGADTYATDGRFLEVVGFESDFGFFFDQPQAGLSRELFSANDHATGIMDFVRTLLNFDFAIIEWGPPIEPPDDPMPREWVRVNVRNGPPGTNGTYSLTYNEPFRGIYSKVTGESNTDAPYWQLSHAGSGDSYDYSGTAADLSIVGPNQTGFFSPSKPPVYEGLLLLSAGNVNDFPSAQFEILAWGDPWTDEDGDGEDDESGDPPPDDDPDSDDDGVNDSEDNDDDNDGVDDEDDPDPLDPDEDGNPCDNEVTFQEVLQILEDRLPDMPSIDGALSPIGIVIPFPTGTLTDPMELREFDANIFGPDSHIADEAEDVAEFVQLLVWIGWKVLVITIVYKAFMRW